MKTKITILLTGFVFAVLFAVACTASASGNSEQKKQTVADLKNRVELLKKADAQSGAVQLASKIESELLSETNTYGLSKDEVESLQFLYAYMPVNDMAENTFDFFVDVTKLSYATKTLPWGEAVTSELFQYFVLPVRVNNETLDNAREMFYRELAPRVMNMNMYDAVIEINHWCREKIVYQPTDGRTTPPATTVVRAYGRCGEESTVTVAALRSVGIPARQVYVPRWAHTNSNHAWVEVWVDGTWYYLGACEPEPMLDRGWFTASASRAMLVNTFAYGPLKPSDDSQIKGEVISQNSCFTEVSSTATYAPVKKAVVKITDESGAPVENVAVAFNIINGNSLSSMADRVTDKDGVAYLTTGLGTFVVEVFYAKDGKEYYAARLLSVPNTDVLEIKLDRDERRGTADSQMSVVDFAITPPAETRFPTALTDEVQKAHDAHCAADDSIRLAHIATFRFNDPAAAQAFSAEMVKKGLPKDMETRLANLLPQTLSAGFEVEKFFNQTAPENLKLAVELMEVIRVKDIQEITAATYADYLNGVTRLGEVYKNDPIFVQTVLNPRFSNELPIAYKAQLWDVLTANGMTEAGAKTETIAAVTAALNKIMLVSPEELNPRGFYMTPASVANFGIADNPNYTVYARALFATAGIPTRVNPLTAEMQILVDGNWQDYATKSAVPAVKEEFKGTAELKIEDPEGKAAGRRYQLQRWSGDGYRSVGGFMMGAMGRGTDSGSANTTVEPGLYRIVTSIRAADGSMLARIMTFVVEPDSKQTITAQWHPVKEDELVVIGSLDAEWKYTAKDAAEGSDPASIIGTVGRNFFVLAFLEPTKEPSQHFIRELSGIGDAIKIPIVIMFNDKEKMDFYFKQDYKVSDKINYGFDSQDVILKGLSKSLATTDLAARMPVVVVADSFGNIYYKSIGYSIGIPEAITKLKLPIQ